MTLYVIFAGDTPAWVKNGHFPANRAYENIGTAKAQITNYTNVVKRQKKYGYKDFRGDYKVLPEDLHIVEYAPKEAPSGD